MDGGTPLRSGADEEDSTIIKEEWLADVVAQINVSGEYSDSPFTLFSKNSACSVKSLE